MAPQEPHRARPPRTTGAARSRSCSAGLRGAEATEGRHVRASTAAPLRRAPSRRVAARRAAERSRWRSRNLPLLIGQGAGGTSYSVPIQTLLFFTALSFLPAVLLLMTGFTRIVIVLSLLRQALGTQAAPPNQVIVGLSLFLTFFVMSPTLDKVYADAYQPYRGEQDRLRRGAQARRGADARVHAEADAPEPT